MISRYSCLNWEPLLPGDQCPPTAMEVMDAKQVEAAFLGVLKTHAHPDLFTYIRNELGDKAVDDYIGLLNKSAAARIAHRELDADE